MADATSHGPSHVYSTSGSLSCRATVDSRQLELALAPYTWLGGSHTHIMLALVRIMPALCLMLALADYAARLIGAALRFSGRTFTRSVGRSAESGTANKSCACAEVITACRKAWLRETLHARRKCTLSRMRLYWVWED